MLSSEMPFERALQTFDENCSLLYYRNEEGKICVHALEHNRVFIVCPKLGAFEYDTHLNYMKPLD